MYENLKKKFGQNFLIDSNIQTKISNLIPRYNLNIIEIGPGDGRLTQKIIEKKPKKLTLIEKDFDLIKILNDKFSKLEYVNILNSDFLEIDIKDKYHIIISNLPYNISSQVIAKISLLKNSPKLLKNTQSKIHLFHSILV